MMGDRGGLVLLAIYLLVVLAIGAWSVRRTRTRRDFFLAGQRLGLVVTAVATMAAAFSGFVFLGGPGLMYRDGIGALFICLPIGVTPALLGWVIAVRLRLYAEADDVLTLPDVVRRRYGSRSATVGTAVTILLGCVGYLAAQLLALGVLLEVLLGWELSAGVWVGLLVILAYSVSGGMVAGAWTDFAQGLLMLMAASAVLMMTLGADGGVGATVRSIAASDAFGPAFFAPFHGSSWGAASLYLVFSIGTLAQPQILHKIMMVRDVGRLQWLPLALGGSQIVCLGVWLGFGLLVPAAVATGTMGAVGAVDQAVPAYLTAVAPRTVAGLVLVAVVAAIMSTADSFLNLAAGALRYDLPRALRPSSGERGAAGPRSGEKVAVDAGAVERRAVTELRWATLWIGLAAGVLAVGYGDLIALLGTFAFGTFAAGLVPALVVGLNWPGASPRAAALSIWTGLVLSVVLELVRRGAPELWLAAGLPAGPVPAAVALLVSLATLFVASGLDRRPRRLDALSREILSM